MKKTFVRTVNVQTKYNILMSFKRTLKIEIASDAKVPTILQTTRNRGASLYSVTQFDIQFSVRKRKRK